MSSLLLLLMLSVSPAVAQQPVAAPSPAVAPAPPLFDPGLIAAHTAFDRGDWTEAARLARTYLDTHAASPDALYLLAITLFHQGDARESLNTFTRAARLQPPSPLQLRIVAQDYVLLNDYTDADRWISRSLAGNPQDGESWYVLGRVRQTANRFADAVVAFRKALTLTPRSVKAENNLGLALEGLNQPDQAIAAYQQALAWQATDPHPSAQPFLNLGILLTDRNRPGEALPLLERAVALDPDDARAHRSLGRLYARMGNLTQAQTELEKAVSAEPEDASLHFQLGQVYRREGQQARSTAELNRAAALEAKNRR